MAPKSATPATSSGSSYTSSGSGEEEEGVQLSPPQKKPPAAAPKPSPKAPIKEDSSTGDYSSSDDSASDSAAAEPYPPLASSPPVAAASVKKKRKEAPSPPPPENNNESGGGGGIDGQKRQRFQRLWSEADEIAILRGMLNHQVKTGALPSKTDMAAFRDSIHNNLTMGISVKQLNEKVRRLRSKYGKNMLTASSRKPHNSAVHELSRKIWGASNGAGSAGKNGKAKEVEGAGSAGKNGKAKEVVGAGSAEKIGNANVVEGAGSVVKNEKAKEVEGNGDSAKVKPRYTFMKHVVTGMKDCLPCSVTLEEVFDFVDDYKAMSIEESLKKLWKLKLKNQAREMEIKKATNMVLMEALEKMG